MTATQIVLLNYNSFQDTFECVNSILQTEMEDVGIIIVDNDSKDDSLKNLREKYDTNGKILFIESKENLGFSGGCNLGIQRALDLGAEYVLLLNNDTIVTAGFLRSLLQTFSLDPSVGIAGGKTFFHEDPNSIWDAGGFISHSKFMGIRRTERSSGIDEIGEVGFITGCLALIKKEVFYDIGLLPEAYFFGSEEWEFSLRANRAGYKLMYTPQCEIFHKVGKAHDYRSAKMLYNTYRNRVLFVKRNFGFFKFIAFLHVFLLVKFSQRIRGKGQLKNFSWGQSFNILKSSYVDSFKYNSVSRNHLDKFQF